MEHSFEKNDANPVEYFLIEGWTFRSFPFGTLHSFTFLNKERYVPVRFLKRMDAQPCFNSKLIFKMCVGSGNSKNPVYIPI